jgi:hypothetical protein
MFRIVFWDVLPFKMVDNHFTRQYIPEDNFEHHTRRRENLKSHKVIIYFKSDTKLWFLVNTGMLVLITVFALNGLFSIMKCVEN